MIFFSSQNSNLYWVSKKKIAVFHGKGTKGVKILKFHLWKGGCFFIEDDLWLCKVWQISEHNISWNVHYSWYGRVLWWQPSRFGVFFMLWNLSINVNSISYHDKVLDALIVPHFYNQPLVDRPIFINHSTKDRMQISLD